MTLPATARCGDESEGGERKTDIVLVNGGWGLD